MHESNQTSQSTFECNFLQYDKKNVSTKRKENIVYVITITKFAQENYETAKT